MSVVKRGKKFYSLRIRPFGELVNVRTSAITRAEARSIEMAVLTACRSGDYRGLEPAGREVCIKVFKSEGRPIPMDLSPEEATLAINSDLTLWQAVEVFLRYPTIKDSPTLGRYIECLSHVVGHFGKDFPVKEIWIPQIRQYQVDRMSGTGPQATTGSKGKMVQKAAPATVNKEKGVLSKLFNVLVELKYIEANPARLVKNLSEKSGERQVYVSFQHFQEIVTRLPEWFRPVAQVAYYTGMRRGEIVSLTHRQVNLSRRLIYLGPDDVKEGDWKRVPIHRDLVPILEDILGTVRSISTEPIFQRDGEPVRKPTRLRRAWDGNAIKIAGFDYAPRFHDLRGTWKTNARRSGMDPEIREAIMGHWFKQKSVSERYGRISDQELLQAIDKVTFDHGETEIWVASPSRVIKT